jgi:ribosomal protein S17
MTLIITVAAKNKVIQASDRRLTHLDGRLYNDQANKAVCVSCNNAVFSVAYTGIAHVDGRKTDEWIADYFAAIPDIGQKPIHEIQRELTDYASAAFSKRSNPPLLQMVLSGFHLHLNRPFIMSILNAKYRLSPTSLAADYLEPPSGNFRNSLSVMQQIAGKRSGTIIQLNGLFTVAHPNTAFGRIVQKRLKKTKKYAAYMEHYEVADNLVSAVRLAHRHPELGHAIGKDVLVMIHDIADREQMVFEARYYAVGLSPDGYTPHLFSPNGNQRGTLFPYGGVPASGIWTNKPPERPKR